MLIALLTVGVAIVGSPPFWYCVVALWCAHIISRGIRRGLQGHAVVLRRRIYPNRDDEPTEPYEELPYARDMIRTGLDQEAFRDGERS